MFNEYKSPITIIQEQMAMQMKMEMENGILKAVQRYNIDVDKEELLKALKYDREQYEKGYQAGLNANKWIPIGQYITEPSLLCFEDGSMAVGYYDESDCVCINMGGGYSYYTLEEPIAYMHLPPAYKGE